jgi:endonuclease
LPPVRLIVARCSVDYSGRLTARLPEALRLIMLKADGSVLVHADAGGYKPLNKGLLPLLRSLCGTP